jgi:hypothetical protein
MQAQMASAQQPEAIPASTKPLDVQSRSMGEAPPSVPKDFQLKAVQKEKGDAPPPVPPKPGPQQKPTLEAMDKQVLQSVDDHAIQVSVYMLTFWFLFLKQGISARKFY